MGWQLHRVKKRLSKDGDLTTYLHADGSGPLEREQSRMPEEEKEENYKANSWSRYTWQGPVHTQRWLSLRAGIIHLRNRRKGKVYGLEAEVL